MIGCSVSAACFEACLFFEASQQPTFPQVRQRRRLTQVSPISTQLGHESAELGSTGSRALMWEHFFLPRSQENMT
jgi:hypothetical protein